MRVIFIYNPHNANEVSMLDKVREEMLETHVKEFKALDFQDVKDVFMIRATPAVIAIRDDLQGENLLDVDVDTKKIRLVAEIYKHMQDEELNMYHTETNRVDHLLNQIVASITEQKDYLGKELVRVKLSAKKDGVVL